MRANDTSPGGGDRVTAGRLNLAGVGALRAALSDAAIVARYESKTVTVPDTDCLFWSGAVSGRGHGRFWLGDEPGGDSAPFRIRTRVRG